MMDQVYFSTGAAMLLLRAVCIGGFNLINNGDTNMGALEREEQLLEEALENGEIGISEYNREMRWLHEEADGGNDF